MPESVSAIATPSVTPNISTPAGGGTPNVSTPAVTPDAGGAGGAGGQGAKETPSKFSFDLGDGAGPTEIDFSDEHEAGGTPGGASEFKFADLDAIKETHPDLHKSLKAELSKATRYSKFGLKSPEDYRAVTERIDRMSGGKGLDGLESTVSNMAHELQSFRSGDVTNWAKEAPEEFGIAASKIADQWAQADSRGYVGHVAKAAMFAMLQKDTYGQSALDAFNAAYAATSDPNTKKLLDRVAHTLDNINQNSQYVPDTTAVRQRQLDTQAAKNWSKEVDVETQPMIRSALSKALNQASEQFGLEIDADDRGSYMKDMEDAWMAAAKKDTKFARALAEAGQTKNLEAIKSLVKNSRQAFAAEALKAIYRTKLSKLKANLRREAGSKQEAGSGGGVSSTTLPWTGKMDQRTGSPAADFDFPRMKAEDPDMLYDHKFYVKGKKEMFTF